MEDETIYIYSITHFVYINQMYIYIYKIRNSYLNRYMYIDIIMEEGKMTLYVYINIYVCIVLPSSFLYKKKKGMLGINYFKPFL